MSGKGPNSSFYRGLAASAADTNPSQIEGCAEEICRRLRSIADAQASLGVQKLGRDAADIIGRMLSTLQHIRDVLADRMDCDDGIPSWEMNLVTEIDEVLTKAGV